MVKLRWELRAEEREYEEKAKFGKDAWEAIDLLFTDEELRQQKMDAQIEDACMRTFMPLVRTCVHGSLQKISR